ncbi:MAG: energy-coupling factor ABC transporter permease [Marinilabiliaceae bacterium]
MHISDGIIDTHICIAANAVAIGLVWFTGRKTPHEDVPRIGMTAAALFVASLIHFPVAGTSLHLGLLGIAGIILGKRAFPAIFAAFLFQTLIFQHGGLITLGVNAINMGAGAFVAWLVWRFMTVNENTRAFLAGMAGIIVPMLLMVAEFRLSGYGSRIVYLMGVHFMGRFDKQSPPGLYP